MDHGEAAHIFKAMPHGEPPVYLEDMMIYCFKKMRELRLTHIFFLHCSISLIIGGAVIVGLFLLGGGLQFYSVVVLCIMYTQPTFFILRNMKMYEIKQELKYGEFTPDERIELAIQASIMKPEIDIDFIVNIIVVFLFSVCFFFYNYYLLNYYEYYMWLPFLLVNIPGIAVMFSLIRTPKESTGNSLL